MSLKANTFLAPVLQALSPRWQALSEREQRLLTWGAVLLAVAMVWWVALAPALRTLREAPAQQAALDAQWQQLQELQAQARSLQQQPRMTQAEALRALQQTSAELWGAKVQIQTTGDRSTVTLQSVSAQALGDWLAQVRTRARAVPQQAHLKRDIQSDAKADKTSGSAATLAPTWSGSLVLSLPAP
jgi:general secretion pathway protein M